MSQLSKRNAEDASMGDTEDTDRIKKRRVRGNKKIEDGSSQNEQANRTKSPTREQTPKRIRVDHLVSPTKSPVVKQNTASSLPGMGPHTVTPARKNDGSKNVLVGTVSKNSNESHEIGNHESRDTSLVMSKHKKSKKNKSQRQIEEQGSKDLSSWNMSRTAGGIFLNHDPVLTPKNDYVILATKRDIQIYSSATSLLVRAITPSEPTPIVSYVLSDSGQSAVLVGHSSGSLALYSIITGRKLSQWQLSLGLRHICLVSGGASGITILSVASRGEQSDMLQMHVLGDTGKVTTQLLLQKSGLQPVATVSLDCSTIVAFDQHKIYIGSMKAYGQDTIARSQPTWHEFSIAGRISCCHVSFAESTSKRSNAIPAVSVAVGLQNGVIMVFDDLLTKLTISVKGTGAADILGRRLHWHRSAVRAVKWSPDGNYLISGGDESVLVIWQLETNRKQFLPHLSTSILNINVSRSGAHYTLRLADNSVMILSTEDLMPSTNISGLSIGRAASSNDLVLIHPQHINQLLAAVPAVSIAPTSKSATHIQNFDIDTSLQLSKQALTRNLATTVTVGPDGVALQEPCVTNMQISFDGKWLATVDEWRPNLTDQSTSYLAKDDEAAREQLCEIALRFWSWIGAELSWEPVTRIDDPHLVSQHTILAMGSNPTAPEFATMGSDGCLKIWTPKARVRDGLAVRSKTGEPLYTWSIARQFQIEKDSTSSIALVSVSGTLAYSEDGSVLAVSWSHAASRMRMVHFIDARTGTITLSLPQLLDHGRAKLCFSGRCILALSKNLIIFDTISLQAACVISLDSLSQSQDNTFMVVSPQTNTFVVGVPSSSARTSQLSIFDIDTADQGPITTFTIQDGIRALLADTAGRGYILLDTESRVRRISPPGASTSDIASMSSALLPQSSTALVRSAAKDATGVFGRGADASEGRNGDQTIKMLEGAAEVGDARARSLDQLLAMSDAGSGAAGLGVGELFESVARAVSGIRVEA